MYFSLALVALPTLAQASQSYVLNSTIPWGAKNTTSNDQVAIGNGIAYVSDRTNSLVHAIDLASGKQTATVDGFRGQVLINGKTNTSLSGPNGLVFVAERNELWVGDASGVVRVVDVKSNQIVANITTGGNFRADEFAYNSKLGLVAVTQPADTPPFVAIISTTNRTTIKNITFSTATGGLEQPQYATDGNFYVSVPVSDANPGGEIAVINASTLSVTKSVPIPECIPAGIIFSDFPKLFVGCSADQKAEFNKTFSLVMDVSAGTVLGNITGLYGVDQVAYDSSSKLFFAAAYQDPSPQLAVIGATSYNLVQSIATDNVTAHGVAVDSRTNKMVIPLAAKGIAIYDYISTNASGNSGTGSPSATSSSTAPLPKSTSGSTQFGAGATLGIVLLSTVFNF